MRVLVLYNNRYTQASIDTQMHDILTVFIAVFEFKCPLFLLDQCRPCTCTS